MSVHAFYAPSAAHRWMECPGSLTLAPQPRTSSKFAADGTASHELGAWALNIGFDCAERIGRTLEADGYTFVVDQERADYVQVYVDDVRRRALGGQLLVEHRVDLSAYLGEGQSGTADALIYEPLTQTLTCEDLKYGTGEKVYAKMEDGTINPQGGLYLLGFLADAEMFFGPVTRVKFVVCQPRLGWIDEFEIDVNTLRLFAARAVAAKGEVEAALELIAQTGSFDAGDGWKSTILMDYLRPGEKQCRWCPGKAVCPSLRQQVAREVHADFDTIEIDPPPVAPTRNGDLAKAYHALPLIKAWVKAVEEEVPARVAKGDTIFAEDGTPYKFVEGDEGARAWADKVVAEQTLLGILPPEKVYTPQKVITAPQAAKLLDKKATKETWNDVFVPLITRSRGRPLLVAGSDPRAPFTGAASEGDFDEIE